MGDWVNDYDDIPASQCDHGDGDGNDLIWCTVEKRWMTRAEHRDEYPDAD